MSEIWQKVKDSIQEKIPDHSFRMWIDTITAQQAKDKELVLYCPNSFSKKWVQKNFSALIDSELKTIAGKEYRFSIEIENSTNKIENSINEIENSTKKSKNNNTKKQTVSAAKTKKNRKTKNNKQLSFPSVNKNIPRGQLLNKGFTFDQFVVGENNDFAYTASVALASQKKSSQNTLFLVSKTGLGKSHLSYAISDHIITHNPSIKVYYITAENFANEMIQSLQNKGIKQFKEKYRRMCDVFILEDVHFLSGKEKTQDELACTLDALLDADKRLIFTSCYSPNDIPKLHDNLESRLSSGVISYMESPDYETRVRILEKKAAHNNITIPEEVNHYLAGELVDNVRQLESGLIGVASRSSLMGVPMNIDLAETVIGNIKQKQQKITVDAIKKLVCSYYKVSHENLISKSRKKIIVKPRQLAIYLCRRYTKSSLQSIGKSFHRYHGTALHSINAIEKDLKKQGALHKQIEFLSKKLESGKI
ncbi:Chromosomal replication initiator protein DnaA [Candidatus Magnetomoraceae bacterium gMMP-15]